MEGVEGGVFSKAPKRKPLLLLKMKIKQNSDCPNKEYNVFFKHIHQNTGPIPEEKKSTLINDWENIIAYWEELKQREV